MRSQLGTHTLRPNVPQTVSSGSAGNYPCCTRESGYPAIGPQSTFLFPTLSGQRTTKRMTLTRGVKGDCRHRVHVGLGDVFYYHGNIEVPGPDRLVV